MQLKNLSRNIIDATRAALAGAKSRGFAAQLFAAPVYTPPRPNMHGLLKMYREQPWVRTIVGRVSEAVARQEWYLLDGDAKVLDHPFLDFLRAGSEFLTAEQSLAMTQTHLDLAGESFWIIGRNEQGKPASYLPMPPSWVSDVQYQGDRVLFRINPTRSGKYFDLTDRDVLWFKSADPADPTERGTSITRALSAELETDTALGAFLFNFVKNRARPDIIVTGTEQNPLNEQDVAALESIWLARFQGDKNAGKPLFSKSPIELKELGHSLRDTQMKDLREYQRGIIMQVYGVSPEVFGDMANANRASAEAADYLFARYTIDPRLAMLRSILQRFATREFPDIRGSRRVQYETPIAENREHHLNVMRHFPSAFTVNEVRKLAGHEPIEGGDERVGSSVQTDVSPNELEDAKQDSKKKTARRPSRKRALTEADVRDIVEAIREGRTREETEDLLYLALLDIAIAYNLEMQRELGQDDPVADGSLDGWARDQAAAAMLLIDLTTQDELVEALRGKSSERDIVAAIAAVFSQALDRRAAVIATTEANRAANQGRMRAINRLGGGVRTWVTRRDEAVRSSHVPMDGQTKGPDEPFVSGAGNTAMHPGGFGLAAEDANCRCVVVPGRMSDEDERRAASDEYVASLADYEMRIRSVMEEVFAVQKTAVLAAAVRTRNPTSRSKVNAEVR